MFILKEIVRLPETEVKDLPDNKIEIKSSDGVILLVAHKEETKKFWLKEIQQYITDVVALQEHSIDDLRIDPKQHIDTNEPAVIKLPHRIEAYEPNQSVKPSDFAEDYTISKYSTTKATEEIKIKGIVSSNKESTQIVEQITEISKSNQIKTQQETVEKISTTKDISKIPVLKKSTEKPVEEKPVQKKTEEVVKEKKVDPPKPEVKEIKSETPKVEEKKVETVKVEEKKLETPKVETKSEPIKKELPKEEPKLEKLIDEKPKALPELKTEIVRKTLVELPPVAVHQTIEKPPVKETVAEKPTEETKSVDNKPEQPKDSVKSELSEVEASVSEKLDRLSQKLRAIRKTENDKEVSKFVPKELKEPTDTEKSEEELRKQEAIRESIQEKIDEDYISESSVIRRIEERYKRNYKDKDIKTKTQKKSVVEIDEQSSLKRSSIKKGKIEQVAVEEITKGEKTPLTPLKIKSEKTPTDKEPEITKAADSSDNQQPTKQEQSGSNQDNNQSQSNEGNSESNQGDSSSNQNNNSEGNSKRPNRDQSPPSPGSIKLPGFFDPPPPTQYETSIEVHVKKEKNPDPPPKITRKVVVKNEELERKTEDFLKGDLPYEKEEYTITSAQRKIKNLKHNLGKTGDTIKFAEDTVSKARIGDFKHIKTPGTVVAERKKDPVFEYQYTVEDPKTGVCITTSEPVDFEEAEEELIRLATMEAEHANSITKRVEGMCNIRYNKMNIFFNFSAYFFHS